MTPSLSAATARFRTVALAVLFVGSGCAALIYEVVWFHLLRLVVGSSAISLGFLLGSFMGGMCIGSLALPRWIGRQRHPLRVYAVLELGIGVCGIGMPIVLPILARLYTDSAGVGTTGIVLRAALCAVALLPPTILMGATLPAIARWMDTTRQGIASLGMFYGANIVGAVAGTLLAGFYLLRVHDVLVASQVAAAINGAIAILAIGLAGVGRFRPATNPVDDVARPRRRIAVHIAIAASGFTALAGEVVWTRLLSLLFGATVYTFTLILAVFLVGLGIGSAIGARLAGRVADPRRAFALAQLGLVPAVLYSAYVITAVIPYAEPSYIFQRFVYENALVRFPWDFARCALAILPAPILWGASFPLALAAAGEGDADAGRMVGQMYAANTVGAIAGALAASLSLIGSDGTQATQQLLGFIAGSTALVLVVSGRWPGSARGRIRLAASGLIAVAVAVFLPPLVPGPSDDLIAFGRSVREWNEPNTRLLYRAEGVNSSVAVTEFDGERNFHVSGKIVASTGRIDMRLQRMLGHLPALIHGRPRSVLVVGCGAGVTAGCFVEYPSIERIVICEIEPRVAEAASIYLADANRSVLDDPRTEIVFDDARHFLATTRETFDIITSDPIHPWVRGAAALYSTEYYELVRRRLNPGAIVTQWVPLYQTDEAAVKSQVATFFHGFGDGTVWNSDLDQHGYDIVLMAQQPEQPIDVDAIAAELDWNAAVRRSLEDVDLGTAPALLQTYAGQAADLAPWLVDAERNDDVGLRLQYVAGMSIDRDLDAMIYGRMKALFRYPEGLFVASPAFEAELRQRLQR